LFQIRKKRTAAADPSPDLIAEAAHRSKRFSAITTQEFTKAGILLGGQWRVLLAHGQGPNISRSLSGSLPADNLAGVVLEKDFERFGGKAPIVAGITVDMEVKRARDQEYAVRPEHPVNLGESLPEVPNMFKRIQGNDCSHRPIGLRQLLHVGDAIDPRARPEIDANVRFVRKKGSEFRDVLLAGHLVRSDFQDRAGTIQRLGDGSCHAMYELVHGRKFLGAKKKATSEGSIGRIG
jgi:hypothetical protein